MAERHAGLIQQLYGKPVEDCLWQTSTGCEPSNPCRAHDRSDVALKLELHPWPAPLSLSLLAALSPSLL